MTELPKKIETSVFVDGYYELPRPDRELLDELVSNYNKLIEYLSEREGSYD